MGYFYFHSREVNGPQEMVELEAEAEEPITICHWYSVS